jgi:hypothetical protein
MGEFHPTIFSIRSRFYMQDAQRRDTRTMKWQDVNCNVHRRHQRQLG